VSQQDASGRSTGEPLREVKLEVGVQQETIFVDLSIDSEDDDSTFPQVPPFKKQRCNHITFGKNEVFEFHSQSFMSPLLPSRSPPSPSIVLNSAYEVMDLNTDESDGYSSNESEQSFNSEDAVC